jgi:hypothetical protein
LKIAFVLGLVVVVALLVYRALRPYLKLVRQFIQSVRHFQRTIQDPPATDIHSHKLVKCEQCETYLPQSRALTAKSLYFCSEDCLKRARISRRKWAS